jgi:lipopolysaccharide/colanic/teichoic acid biosynthesis glycosyltransferase
MLKRWQDLSPSMQVPEVEPYWRILNAKRGQLVLKRLFDFSAAAFLLLCLALPIAVIAFIVKATSPGPVFYRQERVTTNGKLFRIHKFRTMVAGADRMGPAITIQADARITKVGAFLRKYRLDELPQLLDVLSGDMSFVGTRPEAVKYVNAYPPEYRATLLLPAGITSEASIRYKDEAALLESAEDTDTVYMQRILPEKMRWNLDALVHFSFLGEFATMFRTLLAVLGREYE